MSDVSFEMDSREFLTASRGIVNFASRDDTLPMITAVRFQLRPGWLYLSATDRFVLGQLRVPLATKARTDFVLQRSEIARMGRYFPPVRGQRRELKFTVSEKALTVEEAGTISGLPGVRANFELASPTSMPPMDGLFSATEPAETPVVALDPNLSARFAAVRRDRDPMRMTVAGTNKPTLVTIGDYFRGLIMPVRLPETDSVGEAWPKLDPPKPVKKAAPKAATSRKRAS